MKALVDDIYGAVVACVEVAGGTPNKLVGEGFAAFIPPKSAGAGLFP